LWWPWVLGAEIVSCLHYLPVRPYELRKVSDLHPAGDELPILVPKRQKLVNSPP